MAALIMFESPIGQITVERSNIGIARVDILSPATGSQIAPEEDNLLQQARQQILEFLNGARQEFNLPLDLSGMSDFQAKVLRLTKQIPYGGTRTYGEIARSMGKPEAGRAVGGALARNPIPLLIPCHRVVAASGALTGYSAAGGVATKTRLLQLEGNRVVGEKLG